MFDHIADGCGQAQIHQRVLRVHGSDSHQMVLDRLPQGWPR